MNSKLRLNTSNNKRRTATTTSPQISWCEFVNRWIIKLNKVFMKVVLIFIMSHEINKNTEPKPQRTDS